MSNTVCLEVKNLSKAIKKRPIIKDVSFTMEAGKIVGFVGPNGAGKTTIMRLILGLIRPDSGSITICGNDLSKDPKQALSSIAGIIEKPFFYKEFTGLQNLKLAQTIAEGEDQAAIDDIVALLDMNAYIGRKSKTYSLGMQQRLGIAIALINKPKILILDEPLNGLDPIGIREMRDIIPKLAANGTAVMVSSHILKEIEEVCDECILLVDGKTIDFPSQQTKDGKHGYTVTYTLQKAPEAMAEIKSALPGDVTPTLVGNTIQLFGSERSYPEVTKALAIAGYEIEKIEVQQADLETRFFEAVEGETSC